MSNASMKAASNRLLASTATAAQIRAVGVAVYEHGKAETKVCAAILAAGGPQDSVRDVYIQTRMILRLSKLDRLTVHEFSLPNCRVVAQMKLDKDPDALAAYDAGKQHYSDFLARNGIATTETRGAGGNNRAPAGQVAQTEAQRKAAKRKADAEALKAAADAKIAAAKAAAAAVPTEAAAAAKDDKPTPEAAAAAVHLNPLRNAGFLPPRKADKPTLKDSHRYIDQASRHLLDWTLTTGKDITGSAWEDAIKLFHRTIQNLAAKK